MKYIYRFFLSFVLLCLSHTAFSSDASVLREQIKKVIPQAQGDVGVAIKHIESKTEVLINADKTYPMASTYKVPILVELFYQRAAGKLSLEQREEILPSDVHPGGTIALLLDGPGLQMSIHNLINLMMRVSDNSATDILLTKIGKDNINARMKQLKLNSIRIDRSTLQMILDQEGLDYAIYGKLPIAELRKQQETISPEVAAQANERFNKTQKDTATPRHMNQLLEKIVLGQIVDRSSSDEIIEFMSHSMIGEKRIPALLPEKTRIAHKSGSLGDTTNDTGIIFLPDGTHLVITVLMRGAKAEYKVREKVIASITKYAYDYFIFNSKKL